jgi:hypothetical protein
MGRRVVEFLAAVVVVVVMAHVMTHVGVVTVALSGHVEGTMVPMPVSVTDANTADSDFDGFRDDHRFVTGGQRAGKCRHGQKWNDKKSK